MNVLLDTHILLWWLADDPRLPHTGRRVIASPENAVHVSAANAWEISMQRAAGRLEVPDNLLEVLDANDFEMLPISATHALEAGALPAHHADPFDRMLIAQARIEGLSLVTVDNRFRVYDVELLPLS